MTSFTFFSLCLVILVAHWVRCESELSADEGELRLRREDALELYHILKRELNKRQTSISPSVNFDRNGLSSARLGVTHNFGQNGRHGVTGNVGWDKQNGFNAGVGADFKWNNGRTSLSPSINFDRNGFNSAGITFRHRFRKRSEGNSDDEDSL